MAKRTQETDVLGRGDTGDGARTYVSQGDVPRHTLPDALRIAQALADSFAKTPTRPLLVAEAIGLTPTSGTFRTLTGAAIAYGLTEGGYNANTIALTALGRRAVAPTVEGDDQAALVEALTRPRVIREFVSRYNGSKLPADRIAVNVLEELGVAADATQRAYDVILKNLRELKAIRDIKGNPYLHLDLVQQPKNHQGDVEPQLEPVSAADMYSPKGPEAVDESAATESERGGLAKTVARVFVAHGGSSKIYEQIQELLRFGQFEAIVAEKEESVSKPLSDKVMDHMRACQAAVIHVDAEKELLDGDGNKEIKINPNVLIEIGAAMALYGRRFILLVRKGVALPSNLHGLYEVRYDGDRLDYESTMRLLKAFNDIRREQTAPVV